MKILMILAIGAAPNLTAEQHKDMVGLDEVAIANLGIETEVVVEDTFTKTAFAIGRIEEIPRNYGVLSSRIAGRIDEILAYEGDQVKKGQTLVKVESRQPGNPPPVIELKAPIDGLVVASHVRIGEPVEPERELLDISDLASVWAVARVPEHHASALSPGSKARIRVIATGEQWIEGKLLRFGTSADRESGTIDAIFEVPNKDLRMRPGMRAEFEIVLSTREDVLTIPKDALLGNPSNRFVFLKDLDLPNAFIKAPVAVGEISGRSVEILSGIFDGDQVVTKGGYPLSFADGGNVSLREALDAAHGHKHAEDGSELADKENEGGNADDHSDDQKQSATGNPLLTRFLMLACGVLTVLLVLSLVIRKPNNLLGDAK